MEDRLDRCFAAVFPDLPESQIRSATVESVRGWDSVATATLVTAIEEEFGVEFDVETAGDLISYQAFAASLQTLGQKSS
jgi:acyl carrier protein